jgi:uncharacterized phiE125 gp8 family phage protein
MPHNQTIVTLDEIKAHLFIDHADEDTYLESLAEVATAMIDGPDGIGVSINPAAYILSIDRLDRETSLPLYPVRSITSIEVDGEPLTDGFYLEPDFTPAMLYSDATATGRVKIRFVAGFDVVPADLRHAALLIAGHFYRHREATTDMTVEVLPMAVDSILARYRA